MKEMPLSAQKGHVQERASMGVFGSTVFCKKQVQQ